MKKMMMALLCITVTSKFAMAQQKTGMEPRSITLTETNSGVFQFNETTHNFGKVPEGPDTEFDFVFANVGKTPINIQKAIGSCGCTVPEWPHEPILPGKSATIHVTYHTAGRPGPIDKAVTIISDAAESNFLLRIKGEVTAAGAVLTNK